jgi:hypothetical protein
VRAVSGKSLHPMHGPLAKQLKIAHNEAVADR